MEVMWGGVFVMGLAVPGILLLASTIFVLRLCIRLRTLDPNVRSCWLYVAGHIALGIVLSILMGTVGIFAWLIIPIYLYRRIRLHHAEGTPNRVTFGFFLYSPKQHRSWGAAVLFAVTGAFLPWIIGLGVKFYLDSAGRPTLPIDGFLTPATIPVLLIMTLAMWSFPFVILASAAAIPWRIGFSADSFVGGSMMPLWSGYTMGVIVAVPIFVGVFWKFDAIMLLVPVGVVLLLPISIGYIVGWWFIYRRCQGQ